MMHRVLIPTNLLVLALISCTRSDSLPGETDNYNEIVIKSITYLEDRENSISIDQILSNSYKFDPVYPINENKNFTYLNTYWVHLPTELIPGDRLPVGIKIPIQNHIVDVYFISQDSMYSAKTGFFVNGDVNDEIIPVSNIINLSDPGIKDIFIKIKNINDEPPSVQIELVDLRASFRKFKLSTLFDSFLMGMMILIILYGLFLYLVNRDRLYLAYSLYVLFLTFWYFTCFEFGYQVILTLPRILYHYTDTPGLIAFILYIQFMRYFIESPENLPGWDRILRILQLALLVMSIFFPLFMFFTNRIVFGYYMLSTFIIVIDIFIIALIIRLLKSSIRFSNIMALGSFFAISGLLVLAVYAIVFNNYTYVSQKFGTLLELIVFTYGISLRYRAIEIQKREYQQQLIDQLQLNTKIQEEANRELTRKVDERTKEIRKKNELLQQQKEEVEAQRDEIETQRDEIEAQRDEIEAQRDLVIKQKNQIKRTYDEVSESIDYATRLQKSLLPGSSLLEEKFADYFIFFKPKQKVSGDFYWWTAYKNLIVIAVADCTGHGVPGAFMSTLGISLLREIISKDHFTQPDIILNRMREEIIRSLDQKGDVDEQKDGMDIALITINLDTLKCEYAGANNPIYLISDKKLKEFKPDRMPVSYYQKMGRFTNHEIQLQPNDLLYMFSDGYADQFGGKDRKKFKYSAFKSLLIKHSEVKMDQQQKALLETLLEWQGDHEQIDDILVIGIRI